MYDVCYFFESKYDFMECQKILLNKGFFYDKYDKNQKTDAFSKDEIPVLYINFETKEIGWDKNESVAIRMHEQYELKEIRYYGGRKKKLERILNE